MAATAKGTSTNRRSDRERRLQRACNFIHGGVTAARRWDTCAVPHRCGSAVSATGRNGDLIPSTWDRRRRCHAALFRCLNDHLTYTRSGEVRVSKPAQVLSAICATTHQARPPVVLSNEISVAMTFPGHMHRMRTKIDIWMYELLQNLGCSRGWPYVPN